MKYVRIPLGGGVVACCLLVLALAGGAAVADSNADPDSYRAHDVGDGRVSLDVQDAPFGEIVKTRLQPKTRVNIFMSKEAADQPVTLTAIDLHWLHVLGQMTEQIGGVMVRKAPTLLYIERPRPFTYTFKDRDIKEVITAITDFAEANVIVSPKVEGNITVVLNEVPWREALRQAVRTLGYALVEEDYFILRVVPIEELDLESDYYRFKYLRPPPPYKGVITDQAGSGGASSTGGGGSGGGGGGGSSSSIVQGDPFIPSDNPSEIENLFPIIEALREIVRPDNGTVRYMPVTNAIIFTGTKPRIQRLKTLVAQLDVEPPQVFIDMNFVVTSNNDALNLGLKPGDTGFGFRATGADIQHMLPFAFGDPGGLEESITGTAFAPVPPGAFSYGALDFNSTTALFSFLQSDASTRIVQAPKLLALDNQEATIFIGESIRYARSTAATNANGGLEFAIEEDPNSPVNVGFQLLVIPHVIPGEQKIMMTVIPQRRTLTGRTSNLPGFDRFTVGGQSIDLPRVQSNTLVTHMILKHGETAVIGGLLEDREIELVDKVPFLGDIPLAGLFFQGKENTTVTEHLLITITPRILHGTDAANCVISDELLGRAEQVSAEWSDLAGRAAKSPGAGESAAKPCPAPEPAPVKGPNGLPVAPGR